VSVRRPELLTLQTIVDHLPAFGSRRAVGLREDLGLRWWSYERLHRAAHRAAALLRDAGSARGITSSFAGRTRRSGWRSFVARCCAAPVIVPIDVDSPPDLIRRICSIVDARASVSCDNATDLAPFVDLNALYAEPGTAVADVVVPVTP
jgi:hypothetical protein